MEKPSIKDLMRELAKEREMVNESIWYAVMGGGAERIRRIQEQIKSVVFFYPQIVEPNSISKDE